jgi:4-hydroxy-4-methyl-2-oxoglutarate aldolase
MSMTMTAVRHPSLGRIVKQIARPPAEVVARINRAYTGLISDTLGKLGPMHHEIGPVGPGMRMCGPAITYYGDDWTARKFAFELLQPGDVLVIAAGGSKDYASFGDMSATLVKGRGASGVVVDGATRDVDGILSLGLPVFARGVNPRNRHYPAGVEHCYVNLPVSCGGVIVNPGDIILGDSDGVVAVPREIASTLADRLEEQLSGEVMMRNRLASSDFSFGLSAELEMAGYRFE